MDLPEPDLGYIAIMSSALALGVLTKRAVDRTSPPGPSLTRLQRAALAIGVVVGGALGAKLPYVLADPAGAVDGTAWLRDGRTITWGLTFGYFGVELAKWLSGVRVKTGDGFVVPVAVSIGVGRLGCLYGGCCYGAPTDLPIGIDALGDGVLRHPNPLYELLFHFAMATILYHAGRRGWLARQRIKVYLIAYMAFRVIAETLRPEPRVALGMTFYQLSALAFGLLFAALYAHDARRFRAETRVAEEPARTAGGPGVEPRPGG